LGSHDHRRILAVTYVVGDDNSQFIVLGEGDDQLFGGAGDDTVGSTTGNDQIFGEAGDDLLFGGAGNDLLNGGANRDAALYGVTSDGVTLSGTRGTVTAVDASGTDTLTGVELVVFTGENTTGKDRVTVLLQDNAPVAGQYGFNEAAYLNAHQDVAAAVEAGIFASGAEHYALFGQGEGRVARSFVRCTVLSGRQSRCRRCGNRRYFCIRLRALPAPRLCRKQVAQSSI
jgi:Ca2+-binding RTX toxin-like protein